MMQANSPPITTTAWHNNNDAEGLNVEGNCHMACGDRACVAAWHKGKGGTRNLLTTCLWCAAMCGSQQRIVEHLKLIDHRWSTVPGQSWACHLLAWQLDWCGWRRWCGIALALQGVLVLVKWGAGLTVLLVLVLVLVVPIVSWFKQATRCVFNRLCLDARQVQLAAVQAPQVQVTAQVGDREGNKEAQGLGKGVWQKWVCRSGRKSLGNSSKRKSSQKALL
jgi:hypothetical protein